MCDEQKQSRCQADAQQKRQVLQEVETQLVKRYEKAANVINEIIRGNKMGQKIMTFEVENCTPQEYADTIAEFMELIKEANHLTLKSVKLIVNL